MSFHLCNIIRKSNIISLNSLFITIWKNSVVLYDTQIYKNGDISCWFNDSSKKALHSSSFNPKIFDTFNPLKAFDIWYDLEKLRSDWDPDFSLSHFKEGAINAFFTTVDLIKRNQWVNLRGLIARPFYERLQQDKEILEKFYQTNLQKDLVTTEVTKVSLQEIVDRKYCDIEVTFSVKERDRHDKVIRYLIKFHREYTIGKLPDWTITKIKVVEDNKKHL